MKFKVIKAILPVCLTAAMILAGVGPASKAVGDSPAAGDSKTQTETAEIENKNEVVYATLAANGTINAIYVVNHFEIEKSGGITDYGNYKSVLNLTESKPITVNGDTVSFQAGEGSYYYQGNMETTDLPWIFEITYDLDGAAMPPQELAGKTGKLGIHVSAAKNENVNPVFFENYMLQISLTLNADKCKNIEAPDAAIADAGNNKILAFTVLPNKGADFRVTADVKDFTMSGIEISALPFSMNVDLQAADDMLADFNRLPEAIAELNDGVGKLAEGTTELKNGAGDLVNGSSEFKNALSKLKENSEAITGASAQIRDALVAISASLKAGSGSETDLSDLTQLPKGLSQLADGLEGISGGLNELESGFSTAFSALGAAIQGIPDTVITREQIDTQFPDADDGQRKLLEQLYTSYTAGQTVKGTYNQVKQVFDAVAPAIDTLIANIDDISGALDNISTQIESSLQGTDITEKLGQLTQGLSDLAGNYEAFDEGLNEYMDGVGELADGYRQFHSGLSEFGAGVGELNSGAEELHDGTGKLEDEVSKMPDMIQEEIDKLMSEYDGSDFIPVSYASPRNVSTELVQFVLKCEGIELPEDKKATDETEEAASEETLWDRIVALFK
jgi:X-X-X-Leu-X-X-Gly heptad repeat protein